MPRLTLVPVAPLAALAEFQGRTVVVIDTLRATTVMVTALEQGASRLHPRETEAEARSLAASLGSEMALLAGERNAIALPGFDLGNSPLEFTAAKVAGRQIVMTTSNGTRALARTAGAAQVLVGCLRNAAAVAARLRQADEIALVCAGTAGRFDLADALTAGAILQELSLLTPVEADDLALAMQRLFSSTGAEGIHQLVADSLHGRSLLEKGFREDLRFCLRPNASTQVPEFADGMVRSQRGSLKIKNLKFNRKI